MISNLRHKNRNRGVAIVEMVVVLPLLLLMLFVTAEIGRAFMQYNTLTKAVRDSARFVAENAMLGQTQTIYIDATLRTQAQNLVVYGSVNGASLTPLLPGLNIANVQVAPATTDDISVTATYDYQPMSPILNRFGLGTNSSAAYTFRAQATMRAL
jgi:Flp pilus assembly protein TadG